MDIDDDARASVDRALELKSKGKSSEALDVLLDACRASPAQFMVVFSLGIVCRDINRLEEAAVYFEQAAKLAPSHELASLGLFHSLWELGRGEEAFEEMKRFLRIERSQEYDTILESIKESYGP